MHTGKALRIRAGLMLIILALLVTGCGPERFVRPETPTDADVTRAEQFSSNGQHGAAAAVYRDLANRGMPEARQRYTLLAVREYRLGGALDTAQQLIERLPQPVAAENRPMWAQVRAELALSLGNPEQALEYLAQAGRPESDDIAANLLLIRSEALFRLSRPAEAVTTLLERETRLKSAEIADNHRKIWRGLQNWGGGITPESWQAAADPVLAGWLQLAYLTRPLRADPTALRFVLTNWQLSHPRHPANQSLLGELLADLTIMLNYPQRVALLLPLSGRQQHTAAAIRDGFLAAHFEIDYLPVRPEIIVYDVQRLGAVEAYHQAIVDGADFIVGPLLKNAVLDAARVAGNTPTLVLNYLPDDATAPPSRFYQFSLSPEDEARQAARTALAAGEFRAIALAPGNVFGQRLLTSFAAELEQGGGKLLDYQYYDPRTPDYSASIQALLLINESKSRYRRLSANLGEKLAFEPRLRGDVDLIFLASRAEAGKAIRPQLRFHFAGDIPTYATSAIFQENSRNNADLNGIMFPEIPWIIDPDEKTVALKRIIAERWPSQAVRRSRFYAMGYDAYRLMPLLHGQAQFGDREVPGLTGRLFMDRDGRIHRRMPWARMTRGKPVPMAETDY